MLLNFLSNAVKYNKPKGTVTVSAKLLDNNMIRFSVADTGVGIAEEYHSHVFEPFNRLGSETMSESGAGIGLAMNKKLVSLMGGAIGFESVDMKGSVFWADIPTKGRDTGDERRPDTEVVNDIAEIYGPLSGTVLYVEDCPINLALMEIILERVGDIKVLSSVTAEAGLKLAKRHKPNLILMDINLPKMDGIEALQKLREDRDTKDIPVIAVTVAASDEEIKLGYEAGFDDYITKPIQIGKVIKSIKKFLSFR